MPIYKATLVSEVNSVATANVMFFNQAVAPASLSPEEGLANWLLAPEIGNGFAEAWAFTMSNEAMLTCCKVQKVDPLPVGTQRLFFASLAGDNSEDALPSNLAAVISHQTATGGKRGRGRNYFAGVGETFASKGRLTAAGHAALDSIAARLQTANGNAANGEWHLVVYSKADLTYRDAILCYADPVLRNQRDRTTKLCA